MNENGSHTTPTSIAEYDVAVVGGGGAGLAAALQLARSRRSVVVIDGGEPRNAPAAHMHGYLGHDGLPPGDLLEIGRDEIARYGAAFVRSQVTDADRADDGRFTLDLADGTSVLARRVVLATGLVDELPDIPGVAEQWGRGVIHCPYCHGWEVRDQRIVVLATGPNATHQAQLFRQLSPSVTVVVHDGEGPDHADRHALGARGVRFVEGPVARVVSEGGRLTGVELAGGTTIPADAVVVAPRFRARTELAAQLGLRAVEAPRGMGEMLATDARGETDVPGVYAAGNVADVSAQVLQAAAAGARVGAMVNADLAEDDTARAAAIAGDRAEHWDARYGGSARLFSGNVNGALVDEVADAEPGTVLDIGCGEGADAVWLAARGWTVTGLDISTVALDRAAAVAGAAGVAVEWVRADLVEDAPPLDRYDLVTAFYPALRKRAEGEVERLLLDLVAPGGTLLLVGHDFASHDHHPAFDPADYVLPDDVAPLLGDGWTVEVHGTRPRTPPPGHTGPDVPDRVLRARRDG